MRLKNHFWLIIFSLFLLSSCATYYQSNIRFQESVLNGDLEGARHVLNDKKATQKRNRLLFLMNAGWVNHATGNYIESNIDLNKADNLIEDQVKNIGNEALALMTNPMVKPYKAEDFEKVMINYYKALNYIKLHNWEDALVECRRINLKLNEINDKYPKNKNRYANDAFANLMMGLIYETSGDNNNAFIAYRNAYDVYEKLYTPEFGIQPPYQLKIDILRMAKKLSFTDQYDFYHTKFGLSLPEEKAGDGEVIFLWQNGFGPVKAQNSITFSIVRGEGGLVNFTNTNMGISFPFYIGNDNDGKTDFSDLSFASVAFPKYLVRPPLFTHAIIKSETDSVKLELAEDVNAIALKTLHDRMLREMSNSLLRMASKQAMEQAARKQNKYAGTLMSIINMATESADTRNWQTLPFSISYARLKLPAGKHKLVLQAMNESSNTNQQTIEVEIKAGEKQFVEFHHLETLPLREP
jgi:uncharacterized protein